MRISDWSSDVCSSDLGDGYRTGIGEQRTFELADGSKVTLNTATEIRVDYRARERIVRLVRGQALFDVAHAPDRPFSRTEEHTSELPSLMRISYAVFCL